MSAEQTVEQAAKDDELPPVLGGFDLTDLDRFQAGFPHDVFTRLRHEVVIEGSADGMTWLAYEFKGKPGDPGRRPRQWAPYHLRLDWLMWFAALSPGYARPWFGPLLGRLLEGDRDTLRLLRGNPFADRPPEQVRAMLYRYRFTTRAERRDTGTWWHRELVGGYHRAISRSNR